MIPTGGNDLLSIGGPGKRADFFGLCTICFDRYSCLVVPDANSVIIAARGDILSIGRPGQGIYSVSMFFVNEKISAKVLLSWNRVPDPHSRVLTARGDILSIGRPGQGIYSVSMPTIGIEKDSLRFPYLHKTAPTSSRNLTIIGGPAHRCDKLIIGRIIKR